MQRVLFLMQNKKLDQAKILCKQLCIKNEDDPEAWFMLGTINGIKGQYREAEECFRKVLHISPDLADAYLNLSGANGSHPVARCGVADVPSSRFLRPWPRKLAAFEPLRLNRVLAAMRRAAARGEVFHLWFHPHNFGVDQNRNFAMLERIATEAGRLRDHHGWPSLTMAEAARRVLAA